MMTRVLRPLLLALLGLFAVAAPAHEMSMGEFELRETSRGEFIWNWAASSDKRPTGEDLRPVWPDNCVAEPNLLHCGADGLQGTFSIDGVGKSYSAVLVKVHWLDGQLRVYTLTASQPRVNFFGSADDARDKAQIARAYTVLGIEHILTGYDHLLFVFGLLFLVGFRRQLIWTITAFTAAHSITLASAALGLLTLRPPPVEASIALSIVLVAAEGLHQRPTLARRWPALLAFIFGLVHGLGFAGALKEIGLPQANLTTALVTFNLGVEIGQLFTVVVAGLRWLLLRRWPVVARGRTPALYAIGALAAYWTCERVVVIFS